MLWLVAVSGLLALTSVDRKLVESQDLSHLDGVELDPADGG